MPRYRLIDYDVWGNKSEGFWVNQAFFTNTYVDIPEDVSDADIIRILKNEGILKKSVRAASVEISGDDLDIYVTHAPTGRPEFELRREER